MGLLEFLSPTSVSGVGLYVAGLVLTFFLYTYVYSFDKN